MTILAVALDEHTIVGWFCTRREAFAIRLCCVDFVTVVVVINVVIDTGVAVVVTDIDFEIVVTGVDVIDLDDLDDLDVIDVIDVIDLIDVIDVIDVIDLIDSGRTVDLTASAFVSFHF